MLWLELGDVLAKALLRVRVRLVLRGPFTLWFAQGHGLGHHIGLVVLVELPVFVRVVPEPEPEPTEYFVVVVLGLNNGHHPTMISGVYRDELEYVPADVAHGVKQLTIPILGQQNAGVPLVPGGPLQDQGLLLRGHHLAIHHLCKVACPHPLSGEALQRVLDAVEIKGVGKLGQLQGTLLQVVPLEEVSPASLIQLKSLLCAAGGTQAFVQKEDEHQSEMPKRHCQKLVDHCVLRKPVRLGIEKKWTTNPANKQEREGADHSVKIRCTYCV